MSNPFAVPKSVVVAAHVLGGTASLLGACVCLYYKYPAGVEFYAWSAGAWFLLLVTRLCYKLF
jgi:hypothetical protein